MIMQDDILQAEGSSAVERLARTVATVLVLLAMGVVFFAPEATPMPVTGKTSAAGKIKGPAISGKRFLPAIPVCKKSSLSNACQ